MHNPPNSPEVQATRHALAHLRRSIRYSHGFCIGSAPQMRKHILDTSRAVAAWALLLHCIPALADQTSPAPPEANTTLTRASQVKVGFEQIKLPGNESMGMVGATYLIDTGSGFFAGPAVYGALTGHRGGFFTMGGELAWRHDLASKLELQAAIYGGGGGGRAAQVGGGLMLRPHADLLWNFGTYRAGLSFSQVRFVNGGIDSSQVGQVLATDSDFTYFPPQLAAQTVNYVPHSGAGFDRVVFTAGAYKPHAGSVAGANPQTIGFVGARFEQFFTPHLYRGIEAAGAASGGVAGYAEFLGTLGVETPFISDRSTIGARIALGMGGGGAVATGGGALLKTAAYATVATSQFTHLALEGGYAWSPSGAFRAPYASADLVWDLDHPYSPKATATVAENEWVFGTTRVLGAAHKDGTRSTIDLAAIRLNRYVTKSVYLTGQAYSAYRGNAGAFSMGLVGLGYRASLAGNTNFYVGAELLGGAAGGGGIDTSGGAVVQPVVYAGAKISQAVGFRLDAGRIKSIRGTLESNIISLSLNFDFGTARR
jgi:hypothetical protein